MDASASKESPKPPKSERLRALLPDLWRLVRPRRGLLAVGFVLMAVNRLSGLVLPASTRYLVDDVLGAGRSELLVPIISGVLAATVLQGITSFGLTQLLSKAAQRLIADMRREVQQHVGRLPVAFYDATKTGTLVTRIMSDVEGLRNLVGTGLVDFLGGLLTAAVALVLMLRISPVMTAVTFATLLGVVSMVPLTALIFLPFFKPSSMHWSNLAGFHLPDPSVGSFAFFMSWIFVMTWSVLAMEAAACYIGECHDPVRDAKIAITASGLYGYFIYIMIPVMFVVVLGVAETFDPLTVFTDFSARVFGTSAGWVKWFIGIPLVVALILSVLNAIMGCARSLYQVAADGLLPRFFHHVNRHGVPDHAMGVNIACSAVVLLFGSPLRIYIFSNIGYLLSCALAMGGYFLHRQYRPELERPVRLPGFVRWVALAIFVFFAFAWVYGGYHSPQLVVGPDEGSFLFWLGIVIVLAYLPLYLLRKAQDRRGAPATAEPAVAGEPAGD